MSNEWCAIFEIHRSHLSKFPASKDGCTKGIETIHGNFHQCKMCMKLLNKTEQC